jgi:neutral ceramidase
MIYLLFLLTAVTTAYKVGFGIWDVTGPAAGVNFMGYAVPSQIGHGIHLRLRARSFVVADDDDGKRVAFVSTDVGMGSDIVKNAVIEALNSKIGGGIYTTENVALSGTHTHSGPGGFLQYVVYQTTSWGFVQETFDALVEGIANSIAMAHNSLRDGGDIYLSRSKLLDANINRSPTSYLLNPQAERDLYEEDGDTDKDMVQATFVDGEKALGLLNWFAVHATSMNNTNKLISGDNKGRASYVVEKALNGKDSLPGFGPFIAAFASTNLGDVSPNTKGATCQDTGLPCEGLTSSCNGRCELCIASGPGKDMFESTRIIGDKQAEAALQLLSTSSKGREKMQGTVDYRFSYVYMPGLNVTLDGGKEAQLCRAAMGQAFAAGTTDGPGMFSFTQGDKTLSPFWHLVRDAISEPTAEDIKCQAPKPILINSGAMEKPHAWDPSTLPLQIFKVGSLFIVSVPSELTTMAGRRVRKQLATILREHPELKAAGLEPWVVIAGLTNGYASYVVTEEEYEAQRYEAASTIFGPHTLAAYLQELSRLAKDLISGSPSDSAAPPADARSKLVELLPGPLPDRVPKGEDYGQVLADVDVKGGPIRRGQTVSAVFRSANPRNNQRIQDTFLTVEMRNAETEGSYTVKYTDGDWATKFLWTKDMGLTHEGESRATVEWTVPDDAAPGVYRLCYFGDHKGFLGSHTPVPFSGCSSDFFVVA